VSRCREPISRELATHIARDARASFQHPLKRTIRVSDASVLRPVARVSSWAIWRFLLKAGPHRFARRRGPCRPILAQPLHRPTAWRHRLCHDQDGGPWPRCRRRGPNHGGDWRQSWPSLLRPADWHPACLASDEVTKTVRNAKVRRGWQMRGATVLCGCAFGSRIPLLRPIIGIRRRLGPCFARPRDRLSTCHRFRSISQNHRGRCQGNQPSDRRRGLKDFGPCSRLRYRCRETRCFPFQETMFEQASFWLGVSSMTDNNGRSVLKHI
jgi:hypothetical protein